MSEPVKGNWGSFSDFCKREDPEPYPKGENGRFQCPCCRNFTLGEVGAYDICPVCFWEDDGTTGEHGFSPNGISLEEGRANYLKIGASQACHAERVRKPRPWETPGDRSIRGDNG
jgi:Cysteine-rich CPCC